MFQWDVPVQADEVSIYEKHKKMGCSSEFTQTCYWGIKLSLPGGEWGWGWLNLVWLTSGSWEKWNDLGETSLHLHGSPRLGCAENTRKIGKKVGIQGENKSFTSSGWHTGQIVGSGSVVWHSFSSQEKIAEKSEPSSVIPCHPALT